MANQPNPHIFGVWEETGASRGTHADTRRMCKLHTDSHLRPESNSGPWRCEEVMLTTVPPCDSNAEVFIMLDLCKWDKQEMRGKRERNKINA